MSDTDQPHLNVSYNYGTPITTTTKTHNSSRRGSCNRFSWCFSCLCDERIFTFIFPILITNTVIFGTAILVLWLVFRPNAPQFDVNNATLTHFTLSPNNNTLYYNIVINMTFRNPNRRVGIYYDKVEVNAVYHGQRFSTQDLGKFYLGHKKENDMGAVFSGERLGALKDGDRSKYESEMNNKVYNIDLKLKLKVRLKVWWAKPKFKPRFECNLKVPLTTEVGGFSDGFQSSTCDFDW